jgi:hypothetical protein
VLKANLHHHNTAFSHTISKNEAHIRLASSVWYAASYIARFSSLGIVLSLAAALLTVTRWHMAGTIFILMSAVTLVLAALIQAAIEQSPHYQRGREIFFVLHAAALTSRQKRHVFCGIADGMPSHCSEGSNRVSLLPPKTWDDMSPVNSAMGLPTILASEKAAER